ncbi:pre-RNA processing PIH1/Nop17-domain-containing protein [Panaeolus papilionaceus]|nr:pre-RNA processing PIH1/Nop17-domain-containing protein [Panaeolus papilionaceus]
MVNLNAFNLALDRLKKTFLLIMAAHVRIELSPKPGFCIKSSTLTPGLLLPDSEQKNKKDQNTNVLEPAPQPTPIPQGMKVFVNIAWDPKVPPPPEGSEEAIQRAMKGEDGEWDQTTTGQLKGWYVPVIVSNGKIDADKTGKPSLVFDCVYNSTIKSRTLRDPEFKIFLVELALQRIEAQSGLGLSRSISTPNILSKGKLAPRSVLIPKAIFPETASESSHNQKGKQKEVSVAGITAIPTPQSANGTKKPLIEVIPERSPGGTPSSVGPDKGKDKEKDTTLPKLRGILKKGSSTPSTVQPNVASPSSTPTNLPPQPDDPDMPLDWTWVKEDESGKLRIDISVPGLSPNLVQTSTLDISPRSIKLMIPGRRELIVDLAISDAEITARIANAYRAAISKSADSPILIQQKTDETKRTLLLKRQRFFDVDAADAEWRINSGIVRLWV